MRAAPSWARASCNSSAAERIGARGSGCLGAIISATVMAPSRGDRVAGEVTDLPRDRLPGEIADGGLVLHNLVAVLVHDLQVREPRAVADVAVRVAQIGRAHV